MATNSTNSGAANFVEASGKDYVAVTDLKAGAVGLAGAVMQNITHIAPAIAAFFFTQTLVSFAGGQAPLAYLVGLIIVIPLGVCLMELARKFPSAGGYFTYVSRTLGPSMGFLTGWVFVLYSPVVAGPSLAVLGQILQDELASNYGITFPWWAAVVIGIPLVAWAGYSGIALSIKWIVVVGLAEFLIVLALGLTGLADPGPGGFTFATFTTSFNPGDLATTSGFFIVVVLTVQGLTGWEAAVPLAEETENPRRNVPRSIMASILIIGVMLVIAQWGQVIGWGVDDLPNLKTSAEVPGLVIAHRVWGGAWWLTLLAMITSVLGASLACQNVATRMWYSMGRAGVLPKSFGQVHPTRKTPTTAVTAQLILSVVLGFAGPWLLGGPWPFFIFLIAFVLVLGVIFVYVAANVGVVVYYWTKARDEFSWIKHFIFPVGTSLVLIYSIYAAFVPLPAPPNNWTPLVAAAWLVLGIIILVVMKAVGKQDWLARAAAIVAEQEDTLHQRPL
ncbi:MAG TPA: APC family permease [Candidatus Acidoferrum sp.]|nr:APC family permease [Candidatus Acidoferrum sp.]